jgi:hypothetical protein
MVLPLLLAAAAGVLLLLAFSLEKVIAGAFANKVIKWNHTIMALIAFVAIWILSCLVIVLSAGLSHSERIKDLVPARCLLLFLILVGLPGASLLLLRCRNITKESDLPKLKRVSILVFAILISLIFFFSAKSGLWPPLAVASKYNFSRISLSLIKMGVNINEEDAYGVAPIFYAARNGDLATTELLLERGADLHKWGVASLGQASINGRRDVAELLINQGIDVNAIVYEYPKWTVLMAATNAGQLDVVKMLVRKGASVDKRDKDGKTALMIAEGRRQIQIAEFLKVAKAESIARKSDQ